jgi:YVTN family beta-propeller protein
MAVPGRVWDQPAGREPAQHRSPIALAISADGRRMLTANQTSGSVSLIDPIEGRILDETATGEKPAGVAISADGKRGVVTHWYGYDLAVLDLNGDHVQITKRIEVGPEPRGVVLAPDAQTAYVAIGVSNDVVRVDLEQGAVTGRLTVGREPRGLALSPDRQYLLVGNTRGKSLSLINLASWTVERNLPLQGANLRQVAFDPDGKYGYVACMLNRGFATTRNNIDQGWVLGQRITRVAIDGSGDYETLTLDPHGEAAADAHGLAFSPDGKILAVSLGGTHEVMLFRTDLKRLPWRPAGSRDLIAPELLNDPERWTRIPLGGRPTELAFAPDGKTLYVANYLADAIQAIDLASRKLARTIALGSPDTLSLARRGEMLFHDATRSFNQWYSCNTCHSDGHTNGDDFDTMNDGWHDYSTSHLKSRKKVPTMRRVTRTGPWTWHGWQDSLDQAMFESFTKSMQGPKPSSEDVQAIVAYLDTLDYPPNPFKAGDGTLTDAQKRGEEVFRSSKAACNTCHGGPEWTDGKVHDVGLGEPGDVYKGYNPPSLRGVYDKDPYLHDGRAKTLREVLLEDHSPEAVTGLGTLSEQELEDLLAYLKTL